MNQVQVQVINKSNYDLPKYAHEGDAGMDLRNNGGDELLLPFQRSLFKTGIFIKLPVGYEAQIRPRSGMALKKGVTVLNTPGTVDSNYIGEIGVILVNNSKEPVLIKEGERIAQMVVAQYSQVNFEEVENLEKTKRGQNGFGSSGSE